MKYTSLLLWTFFLFFLMFSSCPFRVECRPSGAMGPGPPNGGGGGQRSSKGASSSSSFLSSGPSSSVALSIVSSSSSSSSSSRHSSISGRACPFLENMLSPWPDLYRPDITMKVWETTLVLEGTARSRSEVKADGTFGVTFDLHRIVKGEAPLLRRRKQFRLQFLDNPNSYPSNNNNNNNNVNVNLHSNLVLSNDNSSSSTSSPHNLHSRKNHSNRIMRQQQQQQLLDHPRRNSSSASSSSSQYSRGMQQFKPGSHKSPRSTFKSAALGITPHGNKCVPPKATVKTGRKYFVFAIKWENHFVAVFSPELANKKNTKLVDNVLCKECRQAPSVGATKEMVLKPKERIRIRCRLRAGNPVPVLTWYKDGRPINLADSRYRLRAKRRQSILVIRKTRETDVGEYKCEAKNYLGSAHAITRVVLAKKTNPLRPTSKSPPSSSSSSSAPSKSVGTTPTTLWPLPSTACPFDSYCLNGGTCSYYETIGEFVCQCAEGYKGQRCDTKDISTSGIHLPWRGLPPQNLWRNFHHGEPAESRLYFA